MKSESEDGQNDKPQGDSSPSYLDEEKNRDRARRMDRQNHSSSENTRERSPRDTKRNERRVYLFNVAYEYRWQELKDLFRKEVGEVSYVELFTDENDKPKGCGVVEFETAELAKLAVQKMHRYDLKGRKLIVREDFDGEKDKYGRPINRSDSRNQAGNRQRDDRPNWGNNTFGAGVGNNQSQNKWGNTYGLSVQFLESLGIHGPLVSRVFVANLDYKVDQKKLKEVFKLAGRIVSCELALDKDGKSRGFGIIEYDHPVEAVQAISMLNNQVLYERRLTVRLDRDGKSDGIFKLPEGLKGIGMGLGSNGQPLQDVSHNLPSNNNNSANTGVNITAAVQNPLAAAAVLGPTVAASLGVGVGANQLGLGIANNAMAGFAGTGVDRFLDNSARRLDVVAGGLGGGGGGASLGAGVLPIGGADLGSGIGGGYGGGPGNSSFGSGHMGSQNNFLGNTGGGGGRDFDSISGAMSGGYNNQVSDREFRRGMGGQGNNMGGGNNMNSNVPGGKGQMTDSIIVRNLPNVSWQQLKDKFSEAGDVKYAEVNGGKDMGLVKFGSTWEASRAINVFDRTRWDGQSLDVRFY